MFRILLIVFVFCFVFLSCGSNESTPAAITAPTEEKIMDSISREVVKARAFQEKGQYAQALKIADAMIQKYPGQLDALTIKAEILKEQGKAAEALQIMEEAYAMQPKDKETAYGLAYEYADTKNPKALPLTDTLLKYDKTETVARAWYIKATYFNNTGNEKEAMRFYDSSITADYHFLDSYLDKGRLQFKQKKFEPALKTFALGQKLSPAAGVFYLWVAKTQEALGNKTDAKLNYERASVLDKSLTEAKQAAEKL